MAYVYHNLHVCTRIKLKKCFSSKRVYSTKYTPTRDKWPNVAYFISMNNLFHGLLRITYLARTNVINNLHVMFTQSNKIIILSVGPMYGSFVV